MKRILTTLSKKWPEYIIESLVIVASIIGAYSLDNWNEGKKEKEREKDYIDRFIQDLKRDTTNFSIELRNAQSKYKEAKQAYLFITDKTYVIEDTIVLLISLQDIGRTNKPRFHTNTYSDLLSTGTSTLISDKAILDEILTYYSTIPTEWYDKEYFDRMWKGYLPQAVNALDLEFLEDILDQDKTAQDISNVDYKIPISKSRSIQMLQKFKNLPDIEFQTKQITRTHLVQKYFLTSSKISATDLLERLDTYYKALNK